MKVKDLKRTYRINNTDEVRALKGLTFDLPERGMVFLLGKSGCGKTTLLNILGGLDRATSGEIIYKGKNVNDFSQDELNNYRNRVCGFIFQEYNAIPELTVGENIALAIELQGEKDAPERVKEVLKKVDLEGFENRKISQLSGGQKQRVAIARALIKNSEIIFADEPTGALDSQTGESIFGLLKEISKEKLVVAVSHDGDFARRFADRIIELADGKIVSDSESGFFYIDGDNHNESKKSKTVPFKTAFYIGIKNYRYHPFRMFFCIFFSVICFTLAGISVSLSFVDTEEAYYNALIENGVREVTVRKYQYSGIGEAYMLGIFNKEYRGHYDDFISGEDYNFLCEKLGKDGFVAVRNSQAYEFQTQILIKDSEKRKEILAANPDKKTDFTLDGLIRASEENLKELGFTITGSLPVDDTEVAVPESVYNLYNLLGYGYEGSEYEINSPEDLIGKKIIVDGSMYRRCCTITGVISTNCRGFYCDDENHYLHRRFFVHESFGRFNYLEYELPQDRDELKELVSFDFHNEDEEGYFFRINTPIIVDYTDTDVYLIKITGACAGVIFGVLSVMLLSNFIFASLKSQKRQIGILKSLGAGKGSLVKIYLTSAGITGGIIFVLSYAGTLIGNVFANKWLTGSVTYILNYLPFNPWVPFILLALVAAVTAVSCLLPVLITAKKYPVEHLR